LEDLRFKLQTPGKTLIFKNKGFGDDLTIRSGDIDNGPKPEILTWEPIGDAMACAVTWRVTTMIPACRYGRVRGVSSINWGASWAINEHGDTTRTLTGFIEIALPQIGLDTADAYRQFFAPKPIRSFRREQDWNLSADKKRVDFRITDTQIPSPNAYPVKITAIDTTHRLSWRRGPEGAKAINVMSASITPEAGLSGSEAWTVFLQLIGARLLWARSRGREPFLLGLEAEEDLFGRPQSFRVSYQFLSTVERGFLPNMLKDAGLWRSIGTNWDRWALSLSGSAFNERGSLDLADLPQDDAEVSLCTGQRVIAPNNQTRIAFVSPGELRNPIKNEKPKPEKSWLKYESGVIPYRRRKAVLQSYLQEPDNPDLGSYDANTLAPSSPADYGSTSSSQLSDIIQEGGASSYGVRFFGAAERAGHPIPRPRLVSIGRANPTEKNSVFLQRHIGNLFGQPVFRARWAIDYLLPSNPGVIDLVPDQSELA
jgi:hypothetical protein